ncbi:DinB family protein [Ekhidna sp.]|uniref:DinB family protein n=1 Tax=Ekhidna sp. TaxID=2608089 RepID=UPI003BA951F2
MMNDEFKKLFLRELEKLEKELENYSNEDLLWQAPEGINNSAGNLFLHLCGNLQHFIGAQLGGTGYERDREFEFAGKVSVEDLRNRISDTKTVINDYFESVEDSAFELEYPLQPFGYSMTVRYFLNHLLGHLNYHLGQINYHRRILS